MSGLNSGKHFYKYPPAIYFSEKYSFLDDYKKTKTIFGLVEFILTDSRD